jgi:hypothetical protein
MIKQRKGVLGLETAKEVMITFLVLAVVGIAILLALTSLQTGVTTSIDTSDSIYVWNETATGGINSTGYVLDNAGLSTFNPTLIEIRNGTSTNGTTWTSTLYTINSSYSVNTTSAVDLESAQIDYSYKYSLGRTDAIVGNVSGGLVTFFASTGTIFSILVVIVIILAISIIIWAVGRFGQQSEGTGGMAGNGSVFDA